MGMAKAKDSVQEETTATEFSEGAPVSDADWKVLQHEVSRYIASMSVEMANMARSAKLDLLVYFLDMAHVEAATQAERTDH
jgi:hypothetical protein